ncbi:MAG: MFS transporter [Sulfobacillus acidophilus]|uniref:MFS transporter n=1 Tax=Sulfobacillus acidophilus TaxID=53633 RepID=A0A2T2WGH9_9FIRM|nr:MAG: MFS transporter [Sulfobacillus acidophilus]
MSETLFPVGGETRLSTPDSDPTASGGQSVTSTSRTSQTRPLLIIAIILTAANLRPTITGVGPLIAAIAHGTGLPIALSGMVTTLPLVAFGLISPIAPKIAQRVGIERSLLFGLAIMALGTLLRSQGSAAALLCGMALLGSGVAIANVLLPSLVKRDFPTQIGVMTGTYVTVMNVFAGLGSGLSVPLAHVAHWGWRGSLLIWLVLILLGLAAWAFLLTPHARSSGLTERGFWRSSIAWQITLFMGFQSLLFYVSIAWLPTLLHDRGLSLALSGWLVFLMQMVSLPATFVMPIWATRRRTQHHLVLAVAASFVLGYMGLLLTRGEVWSIISLMLVGLGAGASISLALAFFSLRTHHHQNAGQISGMAQSVGYLLAAVGPITVGYLYAATGTWSDPLLLLVVVSILMTLAGLGAARDVFIDDDSQNVEMKSPS